MAERLNNFRAIATAYRGYEFRSRLEAKYAVFFDLCGWDWSYEPIDLPGWIPDFVIGEQHTLVEIKPFFELRQFDEAKEKIRRSGCTEPVILFGADPTRHSGKWNQGPSIAWLYVQHSGEWETDDLHFGFTEGNDHLGLCPIGGGWSNYIWKAPKGISHPNKWSRTWLAENQVEEQLVARWAKACNISKWIPTNAS